MIPWYACFAIGMVGGLVFGLIVMFFTWVMGK